MNDAVAGVFGYLILAVSLALALWEFISKNRPDQETDWLHTPSRFRRRMTMAFLLACVGVLIVSEAHGLLNISQLNQLVVYVTILSALALTLFILSVRDLGDMAKSAEQQAIKDIQSAIDEKHKTNPASDVE